MSFHNRCTLSGANGLLHLSIPIDGGRTQKRILKDICISSAENWQRIHWRGIVSSYNRSPWFEYYHDELAVLYATPMKWLIDWNYACLQWTLKCLKTDPKIDFTEAYHKSYKEESVLDLRGKIHPRHPDAGEQEQNPIKYHQVFEEKSGFIPHLSILDLLFCEGEKRASQLLKRG